MTAGDRDTANRRPLLLPTPSTMQPAEIAVLTAGIYLALGALFALAFIFAGAKHIDPDAREGTWGFRVLILPGAALLWPLLLKRWVQGSEPPLENTPHKRALPGGGGR